MVSLGYLIDLDQNFDLYYYQINFQLTFSIPICCPNSNYGDKIDSSGSEMHRQFWIQSLSIKFISKVIEKDQKSQLKDQNSQLKDKKSWFIFKKLQSFDLLMDLFWSFNQK